MPRTQRIRTVLSAHALTELYRLHDHATLRRTSRGLVNRLGVRHRRRVATAIRAGPELSRGTEPSLLSGSRPRRSPHVQVNMRMHPAYANPRLRRTGPNPLF